MTFIKENLPNYLTFARILAVPLLVVFHFLEAGNKYITCAIFVLASLTDLLDGYLSRKWNVTTKFGALMDPIADKLLVVTALALLIAANNTHIIPAIGIMCREIFISGLREFLAKTSEDMPVVKLSKWKTALQMISISILLLIPVYEVEMSAFIKFLFYTGYIMLWAAFLLTIYTGYKYFLSAREKELI